MLNTIQNYLDVEASKINLISIACQRRGRGLDLALSLWQDFLQQFLAGPRLTNCGRCCKLPLDSLGPYVMTKPSCSGLGASESLSGSSCNSVASLGLDGNPSHGPAQDCWWRGSFAQVRPSWP